MTRWTIPPEGGLMESTAKVYFQNMTGREVAERLEKNDLIILPIGSTEAHGPMANYGEDTFLVTRLAEQVALATGCTVAQPLWYGSHPYHHLGMPGTVIVPEDIFNGMIRAMIAGFWNTGFRKMILLNGHGQEYVIPTAIHQFCKTYQVPGIFINLNWYHAVPEHFKTKDQGGPFETNFVHADEAETSWSLALFPEFIHMEDAVDTAPYSLMKDDSMHLDKAGNLLGKPIAWYGQVGMRPIELKATPEAVVGKATLASADKARAGVAALMDYMERLINDIMEQYPAGVLPPAEQLTQRSGEELEAVLKTPLAPGWKSIYTIAYPV
jgi:3-dehydro-scyllo-inosose hydrolase